MSAPRRDAIGERTPGRAGTRVRALMVAAWLVALAPGARADSFFSGPRRVSVEILAGSAQPVSRLADYQWDVRPRAAWGAQALVSRGALAAGLRWWRSGTTQSLGLTGEPDPDVHVN